MSWMIYLTERIIRLVDKQWVGLHWITDVPRIGSSALALLFDELEQRGFEV